MLIFNNTQNIVAQEDSLHSIDFRFSWGISQTATSDQLINYFHYSGTSLAPVQFSSIYIHNKNRIEFNIYHNQSRLDPQNTVKVDYEYNYIQHSNTGGGLEYYRDVYERAKTIHVYVGAAFDSHLDIQSETYKNWLYPVAGNRKSYNFSLINLSPSLLIDLTSKRNCLRLKTSCTILNLAARADDDYVKRAVTETIFNYKLYSPRQYHHWLVSFLYQYRFANGLGISAEYNYYYSSFLTTDGYKYAQHSFLLGFSKRFKF